MNVLFFYVYTHFGLFSDFLNFELIFTLCALHYNMSSTAWHTPVTEHVILSVLLQQRY